MNLQQLLIQLRGEESPNQAAQRLGISANNYRDLERGYYLQRGTPVKPSRETLNKIAIGFKVDYNILAKAAGLPEEPRATAVPFKDRPHLHQWYNALPSENIVDIEKLYNFWQIFKGGE